MNPFAYGYGGSGQEKSFGDRTFYGAYLTGLRSWRVLETGELAPAVTSIPYIWTEGENVAECFRRYVITNSLPVEIDVAIYDGEGNVVEVVKKHEIASKACSCGFYAYFPGKGTHHSPGNISGLIKGTGKVVRGPKGFRSEKAEMLAFIRPAAPTYIGGQLWDKVSERYSSIPVFDSLLEATEAYPISAFPGTADVVTRQK